MLGLGVLAVGEALVLAGACVGDGIIDGIGDGDGGGGGGGGLYVTTTVSESGPYCPNPSTSRATKSFSPGSMVTTRE
jgi:hypothetical protein